MAIGGYVYGVIGKEEKKKLKVCRLWGIRGVML
jgi:hypothetical protein